MRTTVVGGVLILGACNTIPPPSSDLSEPGPLLDQVNAKAKNDPTWFADSRQEQKNIAAKYVGDLTPGVAIYLESDIYIYDDKSVDNYIITIVDRLLQGWQGQKPQFSVIIETGEYCNAYVDSLNQIHVSTGLLRDLENEDQLASVLAHEMGHVLLRHNSEKSLTERTGTAVELSGMLLAAGGTLADQLQDGSKYRQKGSDVLFGCKSLGLVWGDILAPQWSRENEREADMLGLDLLIRANYNYEEFLTVVEKIHDANARRSEQLEILRKKVYVLIEKNQAKIKTSAGAKWNDLLETMRGNFEIFFVEQTVSMVASKNKSHDDRKERIDSIKTYLQQAYSGGDLPPESSHEKFSTIVKNSKSTARLQEDLTAIETMKALLDNQAQLAEKKSAAIRINSPAVPVSSVIAKSSIEILKKRYSDAEKHLGHLVLNKESPSEAYVKLAEVHMAKREYTEAERILMLGTARIGRDYRFLPTLVRLNRLSGNMPLAEENTIRCKEYDNALALSLSKMVFGKKGGDGSYYRQCAEALGYDVVAKRGGTKDNATATAIEGALKSIFQ